MKVKAISAGIYESKSIGNCSNNGISSRYNTVLLEHPRGNYEVDLDSPPENFCAIACNHFGGKEYFYIRPVNDPTELGWMNGGSICYSSDSRYRELYKYPLPLHDRQESQVLYDMLSK